jgi:trimeric autotransporter adhesin
VNRKPSISRLCKLVALAFGLGLVSVGAAAQKPEDSRLRAADLEKKAHQIYGGLPLLFEKNAGQAGPQVNYLSRMPEYTLFLTEREAVILNNGGKKRAPALRMQWIGSNTSPAISGEEQVDGKTNYLIGNDSSQWHTGVTNYTRVKYNAIYPGIDLAYYGNQQHIEYDLTVAPGADAQAIKLRFAGASRLRIDKKSGDLMVNSGGSEVRFRKPVVYQKNSEQQQAVAGAYVLSARNTVSFTLGEYDHSRPLVIDPYVVYSTMYGGSTPGTYASTQYYGMAVDSKGYVYLQGITEITNLPTTSGSYQPACNLYTGASQCSNFFVAKFDTTKSGAASLVYATYVGGSEAKVSVYDVNSSYFQMNAAAADSSGDAYFTGASSVGNYPTTSNAYSAGCVVIAGQPCYGAGVLTELDPTGSKLLYSTYIPTASDINETYPGGIAVDSNQIAYIAGGAGQGLPATDSSTCLGCYQAPFVAAFDTTKIGQASLVYAEYVPFEQLTSMAVDPAGDLYLGGQYYSTATAWPGTIQSITLNGFQTTTNNSVGVGPFFLKLNHAGTATYATYMGSAQNFGVTAIGTDPNGIAYIGGDVTGPIMQVNGLPSTSGFSGYDAFIAKVDTTQTGSASLLYATYLTGVAGSGISVYGLAGNGTGQVAFSGSGAAVGFPEINVITQPDQLSAGIWPFVGVLDTTKTGASALTFASVLDGVQLPVAVAYDPSNNLIVGGTAVSGATSDPFLAVPASYAISSLGNENNPPFFYKISLGSISSISVSPSMLTFSSQVVMTTSASQAVTVKNSGTSAISFTSIAASSQFAETDNCSPSLAAGASCTINITFTPTATGSASGALTLTDSDSSSPQSVGLSGAGAAGAPLAILTPAMVPFGSEIVNTPSAGQVVVLSNPGTATLTNIVVSITGTNSNAFSYNSSCGSTLAAGASCNISVVFDPASVGPFSASLSVSDNAASSTQAASLTGTGVAAAVATAVLTPNPVIFPTTLADYLGEETVTLTNGGSAALTGISAAITGTNASAFSIYPSTTCGTTLAAGANCSIVLHFYPTAAGSYTATLSLTDSASGSPQKVTLEGVAQAQTAQTQFNPVELNIIAGTGVAPANCVNLAEPGPALQTQLCGPSAVATDITGNIYIAEQQDNVVKKIDTTGNVTTFAGIENTGSGSFSGDNGLANVANLSQPQGVAVDLFGNVYISDSGNGRIRVVNPTTGIITTFVGGGSGQYFNGGTGSGVTLSPAGIAFDPSGNLYIAEPSQQIVVKVTPAGVASLFAGVQTAGGPGTAGYNGDNIMATAAELNFPTSVVSDRNGNIYIADSQNYRVRYINENFEPGMISTAAGNGTKGDTGDGGAPTSAEINPLSITMNQAYDLFISDGSTIRKVNGQGTINTFAGGGTGGLGGPATNALLQGVGQPAVDNNGNLLIPVATTPEVLSAGPTGILQFGSQAVGSASAPLTITIENTGNTYLNDFSESHLAATGDFSITGGTCSQGTDGGYSPGESCTLIVTFTPTVAGARTGSISVPSNAPNSPQSITLQGTGTAAAAPAASLSPGGLTFTGTVGSTSAAQVLTLSNTGTASLSITSIAATGTGASDFSETNTCGTTLAASSSCTISVTFTPASAAGFTGAITVTDNAAVTMQSATLTGTGTTPPAPQAVLSPSSLTFSSTTVGVTSTAQAITLSNPGNATLSISGITITGSNTADFAETNNCTTTLAAGATCTINVTFTPASAASFTASVSVADNATGSPQMAALSGTGVAPPPPVDFATTSSTPPQTVTSGGTAQFSIAVQPVNGSFTNIVTLSATGLPPGATASFQPATVTPGSSGASSTLTIQTAARQTSSMLLQRRPFLAQGIAIALLMPLFWLRPRKGRQRPGYKLLSGALVLALFGAGATYLTGCGGGFALPSAAAPASYVITVTGTSGSDTHSTTVTLTVQ